MITQKQAKYIYEKAKENFDRKLTPEEELEIIEEKIISSCEQRLPLTEHRLQNREILGILRSKGFIVLDGETVIINIFGGPESEADGALGE